MTQLGNCGILSHRQDSCIVTTTNIAVSPLGIVQQCERLKGNYIACKFSRRVKAKVGRTAYSRNNSWMNNPHVLSGMKIGLDLQVIVQDNVRHNGCLQSASYFALFLSLLCFLRQR